MATLNDDEVVISGISGKYPECDSVEELWEKLINHENMVTVDDRRWKPGFLMNHHNIGKLKDIRKSDIDFFLKKGNFNLIYSCNCWKLMAEPVYEAIIDSGRSMQSMSNTRTAVINADNHGTDPELGKLQVINDCTAHMDHLTTLGANLVSYCFNFKGESVNVDTACASGLTAMEIAKENITQGRCDYAVIICSQLAISPINFLALEAVGTQSSTGACRCYDDEADGYVRSDAIVACFLEKAKTAKRVYCSVLSCLTNSNGFNPIGAISPSQEMQGRLFEDVVSSCGINPSDVVYIEGHGTAAPAGDFAEASAIAQVYCKNRQEPLLLGSIKSNIGHTETASALCGLTKVILAMEKGIIPANLHFKKPSSKIPALNNGQIKVVSENTEWKAGLVAINSFGIGGVNGHAIFRPNLKLRSETPVYTKRKLFAYCFQTKEGLEVMFDYLQNNPDHNLYGLLSESMENPDNDMEWKGYAILNAEEPIRKIELNQQEKRPVCFVFTGFGCQWLGMGRTLMEIECFRESILKSFEYINQNKADVLYWMENQEKVEESKKMWVALCTVTAIQIALVDVLRTLEINPDYIIGHSAGEIASAYADGCLTQEQAMLLTYNKALISLQKSKRNGMMALATLSPEEAYKNLPPGVAVGCHNSEDSVTLSGEAEALTKYLLQLRMNGVVVKKFDSYGFAFHCKMLDDTSDEMHEAYSKIIQHPRPRSSKWISTSIPEKDWDKDLAKTFSAEYIINNFLEPVLFYEGLQHIPKNSIFIEISPHNLLTPLLKRTAGTNGKYLTLMKKNADNVNVLLTNVGEMYLCGLNPKISKLYPPVDFPVPRGTPMISHLLRWNHSKVGPYFTMQEAVDVGFASTFQVELLKGTFTYVIDHNINGQIFFPASGYLFLAWHQFSMHNFTKFDQIPVVFEDVQFLKGLILTKSDTEYLTTRYLIETGRFEIYHNDEVCAIGTVRSPKPNSECSDVDLTDIEISEKIMTREDIYKVFRLLGYNYGKHFQGLINASVDGTTGKVKWNNNWITFIDSMMQLTILAMDIRDLLLPTRVHYLYIDPLKHRKCVETSVDKEIPVKFHPYERTIQAGGIIGKGTAGIKIPKSVQGEKLNLEEYKFIPYFNDRCFEELTQLEDSLRQYSTICETYIKSIIATHKNIAKDIGQKHRFETVSQNDLETIKSSEQCFLNNSQVISHFLKHLKWALESSEESSKDFPISEFHNEEEGDFLLSAFLNELILNSTLEVALENIPSLSINVVEISPPNIWLTKYLYLFFQSCQNRQINYTVTNAEGTLLKNEALEKMNLNFQSWDIASSSFNNSNTDIVIIYNTLNKYHSTLNAIALNIKNTLKEGGFALVIEPKENNLIGYYLNGLQNISYFQGNQKGLLESFKAANLELVAQKSDGILYDLYLLRNVSECSQPPVSIAIEDDNFEQWVPEIQNALNNDAGKKIWLTSKNFPTSGIIGLAKSLALEQQNGQAIRCLFEIGENNAVKDSEENKISSDIVKKDLLVNINRNGKWGSLRNISIQKDFKIPLKNAVLGIKKPGDFGSFYWFESDVDEQLKSNKLEAINVYYAGLSYLDLQSAKSHQDSSNIEETIQFGYDFAGKTKDCVRVMGITSSSAIATCIASESKYIWSVPGHWTLAEAATVPLPFLLAYFALHVKGNLLEGEKVLIHCGADAVGQAAVNVALSMNCEIYVTVESKEQWNFMKKEYPALKKENILFSTDLSFESQILSSTRGKGVDIVLNSLTEEKMAASLRCLGENGRFLNILNSSSLKSVRNLGMLLRRKEYLNIQVQSLFESNYYFQEVQKRFSNGLKKGIVKPINSNIFEMQNIEDAFQLLQNDNNIGKVLIKIRKEETINERSRRVSIPSVPRITFPSNGTVIVIGAFGGFGMEITRWLASRGTRNFILNSRKGIVNGYQERFMHICKRSGINVHISRENLVDEKSAVKVLEIANKMGPVIGIFNCALILDDGIMLEQTPEKFKKVTEVKIQLTKNLDKISRLSCPNLKYFVMFSSVASRGSPAQSNYGYANAAMERICEMRKDAGFPALAIQWGLVGDVGYVYETFGNDIELGGFTPQKLFSCLAVLDTLLYQKTAVVTSYVTAQNSGKGNELLEVNFEDYLKNTFGIDYNSLDKNKLVTEIGLDSLAAIEFKTALEENWNVAFSFQDLTTLTIGGLEERIKLSRMN